MSPRTKHRVSAAITAIACATHVYKAQEERSRHVRMWRRQRGSALESRFLFLPGVKFKRRPMRARISGNEPILPKVDSSARARRLSAHRTILAFVALCLTISLRQRDALVRVLAC